MRSVVIASLASSACVAPLQLSSGLAVSGGSVSPILEATARMQEPVWIDRPQHEALWLGPTGSVELSPSDQKAFVGAELLRSRLRNPRSPQRTFDAFWIRPEIGWSSSTSGLQFYGGSVGIMRLVRGVPLTVAARGGSFRSGPDAGFYGTLTVGVVLSSPLYWMQ